MARRDTDPEIAFAADGLSRRDFIHGSAAIAAALGIGLTETATAQEARETALKNVRPVKCAFIGVGSQGSHDLTRVLNVPGAQIVAICDIYEPHLQRALNRCPGAKGYKDHRALLERKDIEAVLIATPLYAHAPVAIHALQAGKHVFCEKMMAYTIEDAKRMARLHLSSKKVLQIGHQRRSNLIYNHGWELIHKAHVLGKVTHVRAQWNRNGSWRRLPVPKDSDDRHWNWRLYKDISRGLMAELGTHQIQVANWYLGEYPSSVVGIGGIDYWKDGRTVYDNVEVVYEYPSKVKLNYTSLTTNQYDGFYEQFMGKDGTLVVSQESGGQYYREPTAQLEDWMKNPMNKKTGQRGQQGLTLDPEATKKLGVTGNKVGEKTITASVAGKDDYLLEMEDFFNSIRVGTPISCDWRDGLGATVSAVRAIEAMEKGTRVHIPKSDYTL
jgi:predicted dehydrogenase